MTCLKGCAPQCAVCGRTKKPGGRYGGAYEQWLCSGDCEGYWKEPTPCDLWPGESREDFGYPKNWREIRDAEDAAKLEGLE